MLYGFTEQSQSPTNIGVGFQQDYMLMKDEEAGYKNSDVILLVVI